MIAKESIRPTPRGRKREFDRTRALESAMLHFWRHGYEGSSIADLTAAMGIAAPSLYAAFGAKHELYAEAVRAYLDGPGNLGTAAIDDHASARAAVAAILAAAATAFTRDGFPKGCMVSLGSLGCAPANAAAERETSQWRKAAQSAFETRLVRAQHEGELHRDADCSALAAYFASVVEGISVQARDGADTARLQAIGALALTAWPEPASG